MARVFVGNLPGDIRERELDDLFYKYGRIRDIEIKYPPRPPAFAFVTFDDERDAKDACRARDGYDFDGGRIRVEISKGDRRGGDRDGGRDAGRGGGKRTDFRVLVTGLPRGTSWQDLKDGMRKAGDVIYTNVDNSGEAVVEFSNQEDMHRSVRELDDSEFESPYDKGSRSVIRVRLANEAAHGGGGSSSGGGGGARRGRSMSDSRSRSRSRDRGTKRSVSRSRSRSPAGKGRSRSPSPAPAAEATPAEETVEVAAEAAVEVAEVSN